ncbi:hypothetical protein UFOVP144_29 [uncultured Caudovirales phage]|uniref:Uncharacterized protein n=1 Tax=uncultured Caudovirales phage TaxID=2100421 RepID=A0A6J7XR26_9CAUD|nr:hypothetical protein UFOVP144_29 [uncultured Caudovirales phage]
MDTDPKYKRNDDGVRPAKKLPKSSIKRIEDLLKQGSPVKEAAKLTAVEPKAVVEIKNQLQDSGQLDVLAFKRKTANRLASFVDKSIQRLDEEVENIPIGQLMLSTAIALDKLDKLVDPTPTVNIKAELRISADDINRLLDPSAGAIDITPPDSTVK